MILIISNNRILNKNIKILYILIFLFGLALIYTIIRIYLKKSQTKLKSIKGLGAKNIYNLHLNRFPFIGSHDVATCCTCYNEKLPFVKTQSLVFINNM